MRRPCYRPPGARPSGPPTGMDKGIATAAQRLQKEGVVGHGAYLGKEHRDLADRLQHGTAAMVEPENPAARAAWQEILETLFSPEDASLAAKMPLLPTPLERIAQEDRPGTGGPPPTVGRHGRQGPGARRGRPAQWWHGLHARAPVVGFFEFSMMRLADGLPKAELAKAYDAYMFHDDDFLREVAGGRNPGGAHPRARDRAPRRPSLRRCSIGSGRPPASREADKVSVTNCYCRHKASHLGPACEYPMESCMSLGGAADYLIRHGLGREISREEGLELLTAAREAGLVHIADNVQHDVAYICSCCSCCCAELHSVRAGQAMVLPSGFQTGP